ncbi:MAG TPA: tripartite tricarboxylate transporter substrate binding protein, partial [Burkholderiales bacterium]|nr:tripartite tricarboxylate transporter substrate binding protein [Burkholderiales bacterium]
MPNVFRLLRALLPAVLALLSAQPLAQSYPVKPVRVLVGFPPGAGVDITTRLFMPELAKAFGQQFVVDNRPGAAGNIAAEIAAKTPPDGYSLLSASAPIVMSQALYSKPNFNLERDFDPIAMMASAPFILVVHPSLPARSLKEFIALAKSKPGQMAFASTGSGSTPHLSMEMLKSQAGINLVHIPYKGTPQAVIDLLSGQVQAMFANSLSVLPQVKAGRLRSLAISSAKRSAAAPELPTVAESGIPGYESGTWFALLAPAGTPRDIVNRLNAELGKIVATADMKAKLLDQGAD